MRTLILPLATAAIVGCAHTPTDVRQSHFRFEFQSTQTKELAAACAARNAENVSPRFSTTTRPGPAQNMVEVIVHAGDGTAAVVEASEVSGGRTTLRVWLTSNIGRKEDLQQYATRLARQIVEGC